MKPKVPHIDVKKRADIYRKLLVTFLALFQVEGLVTLSLGIWLLVKIQMRECEFVSIFYPAPSLLLASGCVMVIVCTVGIVTTYKAKNHHSFRPFGIFVLVCLALEITAPIHATVDYKRLSDLYFYESMSNSFNNALLNQSDQMECWQVLQERNRCCGLNSYEDWLSRGQSGNKTVSNSFTKLALESCQCGKGKQRRCVAVNSSGVEAVFGVPCYNSLYEDLDFQSLFLRILCPILFLTQITTLAFILWVVLKLQGVNTISIYMVDYHSSGNQRSSTATPAFVTSGSTTTINSKVSE